MKRYEKKETGLIRCGGCGGMFEPKRRNQQYHNEVCKQKAYREREKSNGFTLRNALTLPVLSLFPGIGLLDRAFEEGGFTVVRGPDLLWGDDIHDFHPRPGHFGGIIGGPPCQAFSRLRYLVEYNGYETAPNLIPEFERCIKEGQPAWFIMENVELAPVPVVRGYQVHSQLLNNRKHGGGVQSRTRRISFGTRDGRLLLVPLVPEPEEWAPAVCASGGVKPGTDRSRTPKANELGYKTRAAFEEMRRLQGLPDDFELPSFTVKGAVKAVGNGVPLPLGRAIASAVRQALLLEASS
jgi:DNA (cytosine-5)-methyltransferase 1